MTSKKRRELDLDSPEDREELRQYLKKSMKDLFNPEALPDFEEKGVLSGDGEALLSETEEDIYLQEIDEYSPEERRQRLKLHKQDNDSDLKK